MDVFQEASMLWPRRVPLHAAIKRAHCCRSSTSSSSVWYLFMEQSQQESKRAHRWEWRVYDEAATSSSSSSRLLFLFTFFCVFLRYKNITTLVGCVPDPERTGVGRRCCLECKSQPENGPPTPPSPTRLPLCMLIGRSEAASKAFAERKQANGWLGRRTTPTAVARPYQSQESLLFLLLSQERI